MQGNGLGKLSRLNEALKATPRTGWMLRGVPASIAETISEHMNEATLLALYLGEKLRENGIDIDVYRAAAMASSHDVSEALIGDLVKLVTELIGKETKEYIEVKALQDYIGDTIITSLVREYTEQKSTEAVLAKLSEQLATLMQGLRYLRQGYSVEEIVCSMHRSVSETISREPFKVLEKELKDILDTAKELCKEK